MTHHDPVVSDIQRQVKALGAQFDPEVLAATRAIYRPHLDLSSVAAEQIDVPYGPHERHRLDVYHPVSTPRAVVVFIHGGGFVAGDKNGDGVFYRNIGLWLARQGFVAVIPNYRLATTHGWPAGAQDVQAALQWVRQHLQAVASAAALPLVLWGQSAGASHVATWLLDDAARGQAPVPVDAVMLMSGFYVAQAPLAGGPRAYFGDDPTLYPARSPLTHARPVTVPLQLAVAELDPGWIAQQTYALAQAITQAQGRSPSFCFFRGHNHVSTVQSLGSPQQHAAHEILGFLTSVSA